MAQNKDTTNDGNWKGNSSEILLLIVAYRNVKFHNSGGVPEFKVLCLSLRPAGIGFYIYRIYTIDTYIPLIILILHVNHLILIHVRKVPKPTNNQIPTWVFSEMSFPRIGRLAHSDGGPLLIQFISDACVSSR